MWEVEVDLGKNGSFILEAERENDLLQFTQYYQLLLLLPFHHLFLFVAPIPCSEFLLMFLTYRPNTAYRTPAIARNATTPIDTPSPIDAAMLRPGLGCDVREGSAVDVGDAGSDEDGTIVV
jgi:hypothetical protein